MVQPHHPPHLQETANLEAETFVQKQKVALAAAVKAVLDSWVRFEQQQKESEQADLTKTVIERVLATLQDEKTQKDILTSAIAEVERTSFPSQYIFESLTYSFRRARQGEGYLDGLILVILN